MKLRDLFRNPEKEALELIRGYLAEGATIRATNPAMPTLQLVRNETGGYECRGNLTIDYTGDTK